MSLALRLVLALLLVLNGIGTTSAAVRGPMTGGHPAAAAPMQAAHCAGDAMPAAHHGTPAAASAEACVDHADHGCCGSSACDCACTQVASTALLPFSSRSPVFERQAIPASQSSGHAAPALPFPIRPPIA